MQDLLSTRGLVNLSNKQSAAAVPQESISNKIPIKRHNRNKSIVIPYITMNLDVPLEDAELTDLKD